MRADEIGPPCFYRNANRRNRGLTVGHVACLVCRAMRLRQGIQQISIKPFDDDQWGTDGTILMPRASHSSLIFPATRSFALSNMTGLIVHPVDTSRIGWVHWTSHVVVASIWITNNL